MRRDVIDHHTTTIARKLMCGDSFNTAIIVIEGIYIYTGKHFRCVESAVANVTF